MRWTQILSIALSLRFRIDKLLRWSVESLVTFSTLLPSTSASTFLAKVTSKLALRNYFLLLSIYSHHSPLCPLELYRMTQKSRKTLIGYSNYISFQNLIKKLHIKAWIRTVWNLRVLSADMYLFVPLLMYVFILRSIETKTRTLIGLNLKRAPIRANALKTSIF